MLVTNTDVERLKKLFLELDTTNDGYLSIDEFEQGLGAIMGSFKQQSQDMGQLLKEMDTNGDGKVDY